MSNEASKQPNQSKQLMTSGDVCELLNVSRAKLEQLIKSGALRAHRLGPRSIRVNTAVLKDFLARTAIRPDNRSSS